MKLKEAIEKRLPQVSVTMVNEYSAIVVPPNKNGILVVLEDDSEELLHRRIEMLARLVE